jgi:hypothetical protein
MLPVFLIAMLTLGIFIRMASVSENLTHSLADELGLVAASGEIPEPATSFTSELTRRAGDENEGDIVSAEVAPFAYRVSQYSAKSGKTYNDLIGASVTGGVNLGWPNMFGVAPKISVTVVCRAFTGATLIGDSMPLSELEEGADSNIVWVFPRAGEKYHAESCSVIKSFPKEVLLSAHIRGAYTPCELCDPGSAPDGSLAYIFSGKAYHRGNCFLVERFIIAMDREDAKAKGYTACAKCGGGG